MSQRLFIGVYPAGIVFADRHVEKAGDYKRLAFLPYDTLKLEVEKDCPIELEEEINRSARPIQCQVGQQFQVSSCNQTVLLGSKVKPVTLIIRGQSESEQHEVIAFSMCDPSAMHFKFKTKAGTFLASHGCVFEAKGDLNALPPAMN